MKQFFDPHPGLAGAIARIPEPVRLVANEMDGNSYSDEDALAMIRAVAPENCDVRIVEYSDSFYIPINDTDDGDGMVVMEEKGDFPLNNWRVLRWRNAATEVPDER